MSKNNTIVLDENLHKSPHLYSDSIFIETFSIHDITEVQSLIHQNLKPFLGSSSMLAGTFRRLRNLWQNYQEEGSLLLLAKKKNVYLTKILGCIGLGPLHGLALSEGLGEIHDFVVSPEFRRQGIGSVLLKNCLEKAVSYQYKRLYLETTQNMAPACKLFLRSGFRPVTTKVEKNKAEKNAILNIKTKNEDLPCYFLLENI